MTLIEFLAARLDEDQRLAELAAAESPAPWEARTGWDPNTDVAMPMAQGEDFYYDEDATSFHMRRTAVDHLVAWQPSRVLAEIAAKRSRITYLADLASRCPEDDWPDSGGMEQAPIADLARWLLKVEAQPYRDRPGYEEAWVL